MPANHNTLPWDGDPEGCFLIGRIGKPHGVKGEVTMQFTDDVFDRVDADYVILEVDGLPVPFFFSEYRFRSGEVALVHFDGVDSEAAARALTGASVYFPRSLADADADSASWAEIHGFEVINAATGNAVGKVVTVDDSTANTLLQVADPSGRDLLLPVTDQLIHAVDKAERTITLAIPDGLLDL